jgi:lysophospholipid acyltransferase (LPLAT)-like uncharacterized protein
VQMSRYWRIGKKWDALWIPKPFSRLTVTFHAPLEIREHEDEAETRRLDEAMGPK